MNQTKVDSIFDLKFHEILKIDAYISVMRVHKGFVYLFYNKESKQHRNQVADSQFVPCERMMPEDKVVYDKCQYYNDGTQEELEYKWVPDEAGTRCEYHRQFFRVIEKNIIPNCNKCGYYKPKSQFIQNTGASS